MENACGGGGWTRNEPLQKSEEGCWARLFRIRWIMAQIVLVVEIPVVSPRICLA